MVFVNLFIALYIYQLVFVVLHLSNHGFIVSVVMFGILWPLIVNYMVLDLLIVEGRMVT